MAGRFDRGHLDLVTESLDDALKRCLARPLRLDRPGGPRVVGLVANAAEVYRDLAARDVVPDVVTDLCAAHDAVFGYCPIGYSLEEWAALRVEDPALVAARARDSMAVQVMAMLALQSKGAVVFENGNNLRVQAAQAGTVDAFSIDGFAERYLRPLFCRGIGPFRWVALSGEESDLATLDQLVVATIDRPEVATWIGLASARVASPGPPGAKLLARLRRTIAFRSVGERVRGARRAEGAGAVHPGPLRFGWDDPSAHRDRGNGGRQ